MKFTIHANVKERLPNIAFFAWIGWNFVCPYICTKLRLCVSVNMFQFRD